MLNHRSLLAFPLVALSLTLSFSEISAPLARASGNDANAEAVIKKVIDKKDSSTEQVQVTMRLLNQDGSERDVTRAFLIQASYEANNDFKSLITFTEPSSLKGTKILTEKSGATTAQWIYLPAYKKVNRVNSDQEVEGVLDSDLAYSDLKQEDLGEYSYSFNPQAHEEYATKKCKEPAYSISAVNRPGTKSAYARKVLSVSKARNVICDVLLYDSANKLVKSITTPEFIQSAGRWRPGRTLISTHGPNNTVASRTELGFSQWQTGLRFPSNLFSSGALGR